MKTIIAVMAGAAMLVWLSGVYLASAPAVKIAGSHAAVDVGGWHHTNFNLKPRQELDGLVVSYDYNSFGIGGRFIRAVGARAGLSFMKTSDDGQPMAASGGESSGPLPPDAEDQGKVRHLMLIPENEAIMNLLKTIPLKEASRFHLGGHLLSFEDPDEPANVGGVEWFLVQTFEKAGAVRAPAPASRTVGLSLPGTAGSRPDSGRALEAPGRVVPLALKK